MEQTESPWDRDVRAFVCTLVRNRLGCETAEIVTAASRMARAVDLARQARAANPPVS